MKWLTCVSMFLLLACVASPVFAEVNINTATAEQISDELGNIGLQKAEAIVRYREENGPFKTVDEITNIKGIGMATLEKNRHLLTVGDDDSTPPTAGKKPRAKKERKKCKDT